METDLKAVRTLLLLTSLLYLFSPSEAHAIVRRNAFQMCNLINGHTGRSCLKYSPYGCFCGHNQAGSKPLDTADACCKKHDSCYGEIVTCRFWNALFVGFNYDCDGDNGCVCTDEPLHSCARSVCECDLKLAECLREAEFTDAYRYYDRRQCL